MKFRALFLLALFAVALSATSCRKRKESCAAYDRVEIEAKK